MRQRGLRAIQPKTYVPKTSDGRADQPSPNLLLDQPLPAKPDQVWGGDICQRPPALPFGQRLRPLAISLRSVPSSPPPPAGSIWPWSSISARARSSAGPLADHLRAELVIAALQQALGSRRALPGLIFHSDRGSQYGSGTFRELLRAAGIRQSMSARANLYHNAWTESFIGTLKTEMLQDGTFIAHADAKHRDLCLHRILLQHPPQTLLPRIQDPRHFRSPHQLYQLNKCWSRNPLHLSSSLRTQSY